MRPPEKTIAQAAARLSSLVPCRAGALIDTDTVVVRSSVSVGATLRYLRRRRTLPTNTDRVFIVAGEGRFLGSVPLTRLVTVPTDLAVESLLEPEAPKIDPAMPDVDVAQLFQEHDLLSAAVVSREGHLLGRVTADAVVDVIQREEEVALRRIHHVPVQESQFATVLDATALRTPWLGAGLLGAGMTALVVSRFESTVAEWPLLAALMPIIASMGGIAATQSATLVIRGLARGRLGLHDTKWLLWRELGVAALNGALFGSIVAALAVFALGGLWFGMVAGGALFLALLAAGSIGTLIPMMLTRCRVDPVFTSSFVTTATDVVGYTLLLGGATLLLS